MDIEPMLQESQFAGNDIGTRVVVTPTKAKRVFVVYHAGEVYDKNSVRWYQAHTRENQERLFSEYHNIGDSVVYDSTLKLLDFDDLLPVDPNHLTQEMIETLNSECSYGLIRGSNYLHGEMNWGKLASFIDRLRIPIIAPGIGIQAPLGEVPKLSEAAVGVVRVLSEHCQSIGVRGDITAEALWRVGVKNVRVIGCPSMFRQLTPQWEVNATKLARLQSGALDRLKVSFTLRREIGPDYVVNVGQYLSKQKALIKQVSSSTDMTLFAQGELFEKFFATGRADLFVPLYRELLDTGWVGSEEDWLIDVYRKCLYYSEDIPIFVSELCKADLAMGFRVHGVLPSMANGIPGVLVDYDARTHELIDTFGIPSVSTENADLGRILETAREYDYGRISRKFSHIRTEMIAFLEENHVAHRMGKTLRGGSV